LNVKIGVFVDFLVIFGCKIHFKSELRPKPIEIDMDKLCMKFSALNIYFNGPSLDVLGSKKPAHKGIKEQYPRKSRYFTVVGQSFVETVADRHGHAATTNTF